jgi:hypothetical protein
MSFGASDPTQLEKSNVMGPPPGVNWSKISVLTKVIGVLPALKTWQATHTWLGPP